MAGTVSVTADIAGPVKKLTVAWTCDAAGVVSATALGKISGRLLKGVTDPVDGPTDNYDISILDGNSNDVLANCENTLANRDTTNTEEANFLLKNSTPVGVGAFPSVCDALTFAVANAGVSKSGILYLYFEGQYN